MLHALILFATLAHCSGGLLDLFMDTGTVSPEPQSCCMALPEKDRFSLFTGKLCPIFYDELSIDPILYDPYDEIKYRCQNGFSSSELLDRVEFVNTTELMNMIQHRDEYKRNWCMLSMFFAHNCPFSTRIAPYFNAVPENFHSIKAVAVNITYFSRLISRYGISGTPTILLWVNGVAVARMDGKLEYSDAITELLESWTDLKSKKNTKTKEDPVVVQMNGDDDSLHLTAALISFVSGLLYILRNKFLDSHYVRHVISKFGGNCDTIKHFLNG